MVKVSVIVPVYNVEKYLAECLYSILNQTLTDIEIICVNDGSTDSSLEILKKYAEQDTRLHIVTDNTRGGAGYCRNIGINLAKGKYLSFLDADDFFEPTMLEKAYVACEKQQAQVCVFDSDRYDINTGKYYPCVWGIRKEYLPSTDFKKGVVFNPREIADDIYRVFNGSAWDKLFLRDFVLEQQILFQQIPTTNDLYFVYSALVKATRITVLDDIFVHYRFNIPTSLNNSRKKSLDSICIAMKAIKTKLQEYEEYDIYKKGYINRVIHAFWWNMYTASDESLKEAFEITKKTLQDLEIKLEDFELGYYYSFPEYEEISRILEYDYEKYIIKKHCFFRWESKERQKAIDDLLQNIEDIKNSKTYRIGEIILYLPKKIKRIIMRNHG